jgi:hypothetical protein
MKKEKDKMKRPLFVIFYLLYGISAAWAGNGSPTH